ncbi:EAL domain-containing protein [Arcobacter sp. FWKO B]|uniref:EAL domain-containing response regulator n=1 Tax=Arcobacter sp. FWKO B TaxID=2593672 RepID=UPI0018A50FC5|nr:EAL domain-containing protein [Arcobacter sp. FWKO B]QOG11212.1 EAL domain-containing protein [Arcobacter sp. FWKO B]
MTLNLNVTNIIKECKNTNVLYVEDDIETVASVSEVLKTFFNKVYIAYNGKDGLDNFLANKDDIDIVISDIVMPEKSGLEMVQDIRKIDSGVSIIMLSANSDLDSLLDIIRYGVDGFLIKPLEYNQFISTISQIVEKIALKRQNEEYKQYLEEKIKQKSEELKKQYYIDKLTGLKNRLALLDDIKKYNSSKLILFDINRFSAVNDVYGHEIGDSVLRLVANILNKMVYNSCDVYRISSDQFVILPKSCDELSFCMKLIEDLLNDLSLQDITFDIDDMIIEVGISATFAIVTDVPSKKLLECGYTALAYAKTTNQPYIHYKKSLEQKINHKKKLEAVKLIKKALEEDRLIPYYQPIYKADDSVSYECLARVIKGDTEIVLPSSFMAEIKSTPYYTKVTKTMIQKSFSYFENKPYKFSINLSFEDILNQQIVDYLLEQLQERNLSNRLIIEILESESIDNYEVVKNFITQIRKFDVAIAIDDFGSGYSNFSYMLELEPDYIKIDGSIIQNISQDSKAYSIAKSIVYFANELGIKTIAEFIKDKDVYEKSLELDIYGRQGFFLGKPVSDIISKG